MLILERGLKMHMRRYDGTGRYTGKPGESGCREDRMCFMPDDKRYAW
jgi:hypothetical protein